MFIKKIDECNKRLHIALPLTTPTGKIRMKKRTSGNGYGEPIATRKEKITENCYIEWQISYDILKSEYDEKGIKLSSLKEVTFWNHKDK